MIELIKPLGDAFGKAIKFYKKGKIENQQERQHFFKKMVLPIHKRFVSMRDHHRDTFDFVRKEFSRPECKPAEVLSEVADRTQRESGDWYLFDWSVFSERIAYTVKKGAALEIAFPDYCAKLVSCVCDVSVGRNTITYYATLMDHLRHVVKDAEKEGSSKAFAECISKVQELPDSFNAYCKEVEMSYQNVLFACEIRA